MAHLPDPISQHLEERASSPSNALKEDDGMHHLRRKMLEIQSLALSTAEKARRMHEIMTEDYRKLHRGDARAIAMDSDSDSALPLAATQLRRAAGATHDSYTEPSEADKQPSYHPVSEDYEGLDELSSGQTQTRMQEVAALGCRHYKRNVKVQCWDCKMWFPCRFCHDTSLDLPWQHQLNRKKTQRMLCMVCGTAQPASDICISCGTEAAYYYCPKCKLWDNDSNKRIYHCDDCGICRRGEGLGKDYVHCKRCNVCISISTSASHPCIERATDCDCPLCLEYLFSSSTAVVSLACGHYMHGSCYKELMNVTYRCPVCNRSAVNMELQWRKLDDEIRMQPMPEEDFEDHHQQQTRAGSPFSNNDDDMSQTDSRLAAGGLSGLSLTRQPAGGSGTRRVPRKVWVGCNDCGGRGWTAFHWLGLKCPVCDGYNTNQMAPTGSRIAQVAVIPGTTARQRQHDFTGAAIMGSFDDPGLRSVAAQARGGIELDRSPTRPTTAGDGSGGSGSGNGGRSRRSYFLSSSPSSVSSPRSWARASWTSSLSPSRFASFRATTPSSATSAVADEGEDEEEMGGDSESEIGLGTNIDALAASPVPPASGLDSSTATTPTTAKKSSTDPCDNDKVAEKNEADYLSLAMARLERFGISPSEFLSRVGISPSEFLARLNVVNYYYHHNNHASPTNESLEERFLGGVVSSPYDFLQRVVGRSLSPMRHYLGSLDANARDTAAKARDGVGGFASSFMASGGQGKGQGKGRGRGRRARRGRDTGSMRRSRRDFAEGMEQGERDWGWRHVLSSPSSTLAGALRGRQGSVSGEVAARTVRRRAMSENDALQSRAHGTALGICLSLSAASLLDGRMRSRLGMGREKKGRRRSSMMTKKKKRKKKKKKEKETKTETKTRIVRVKATARARASRVMVEAWMRLWTTLSCLVTARACWNS